MVRQLKPTESGLPLEIYCFSRVQDWPIYEGIQADIFDHIISMLPIFNLRAYQRIGNNISDNNAHCEHEELKS